MDSRLIILAVSFSLLVVSLLSLVVQMIRARRRRAIPKPEPLPEWPMLKPAPPEVLAASRADLFADSRSAASAVFNAPLRAGEWKPTQEQYDSLPRTSKVDDYWDSLISEDSLLVHPVSRAPRQATVTDLWPDTAAQPEPSTPPASVSVAVSRAPQESVAEEVARVDSGLTQLAPDEQVPSAPAESSRIAEIVAQLEQDDPVAEVSVPIAAPIPSVVPAPAPAVVPEPVVPTETASEAIPAPSAAPEPAPTPEPPKPPTPAPAPEPALAPKPVPAPKPIPAPAPAPPAPPTPAPTPSPDRPRAVASAEPVPPAPAAPRPSAMPPARTVTTVSSPAAVTADPLVADVPEHELVAPVEMWFGEYRIGVKAGTRTYDRFQKIASVMFDDLKQATSSR